MSIALSAFDGVELNINPEDLPNFRLSKDATQDESLEGQAPLEVAKNFVVELQRCLEQKLEDDLFYLYDRKFNRISEQVFKTTLWPAIEEIEEHDEDLNINVNTIFLYNELCYRHIYARMSTIDPEVRIRSFMNYIDLFETFLHTKDDILLPVPWIWDIMDEFLYHFQTFCQYRAKMKEDDPNLEVFLSDLDNVWTLEKVEEIFQNLVDKSGVIKPGTNELEEVTDKTKTRQYFGYYSIVCLLRLHVLCCNYEKALKVIEPINFRSLHIFTKSLSCLITLFYYAGFAYLMSKQYPQAIKLFELITSCVNKYKQFYSKSFQYEAMSKQAEKSLFLLGIALAFSPTTIDETVLTTLKDRVNQDKLTKLQRHDLHTFNDSFQYGCPKLIIPIKDKDHFKNYGFERNINEVLIQQRNNLSSEFSQIKELNNLRGVLNLYSTIKLDKLAAVLNKDQNQLQELIKVYRARNNAQLKNTAFDQTILKKLMEANPALDFEIEGNILKVKSSVVQTNYSKLFYKNINKIEDMTREIQAL